MTNLLAGVIHGDGANQLSQSVLPASRLEALLTSLDTSNPQQLDQLLVTLSQSNLLAHIPTDHNQHKLTVRINSLISSQKRAGYQLASLWLHQSPFIWHSNLVNHAASWLSHVINLINSPACQSKPDPLLLSAAFQLTLSHILAENSPARQEFHRQVVTPNLPKFALGLANLTDNILEKTDAFANAISLYHIVTALNHQITIHPTAFRPLSSQVHSLCLKLLFISERMREASPKDIPPQLPVPFFTATAKLLSSLHLTGALVAKGSEASGGNARITQAQLWQSNIFANLNSAIEAWKACVSSYQLGQAGNQSSASNKGLQHDNVLGLPPMPQDPIVATNVGMGRLELFLGSKARPGLLNLLLRMPTPRPVQVPVGSLLSFATEMLQVDLTLAQKPAAEASLCSLQAAFLPTIHILALTLIAQTVLVAPSAFALQSSSMLIEICKVVELSRDSGSSSAAISRSCPTLRLAAFRTLSSIVSRSANGAGVHLDPSGRVTLRIARICATQIAMSVLNPDGSSKGADPANMASAANGGSGSSRKAKKARLYESDSVFGATASPKDAIERLSSDEIACTQAALDILTAVYPHLTTNLSPQHHDLGHTGLQVVVALIQVLSESLASPSQTIKIASSYVVGGNTNGPPTPKDLFCTALDSISSMLLDSSSSTLAVTLPSLTPTMVQIQATSTDAAVRRASSHALAALHASRKGKMIPIARGVGFSSSQDGNAKDDFEQPPEDSKISGGLERTLDLDQEKKVLHLVDTVLAGSRSIRTRDQEDEEGQEKQQQEQKTDTEVEASTSQPRIDVDAITAESDSLAAAQQGEAVLAPASAKGLGNRFAATTSSAPSSDPASPTRLKQTIGSGLYSPDPVKPARRPSTPRIGSPSTFANPSASPSAANLSQPVFAPVEETNANANGTTQPVEPPSAIETSSIPGVASNIPLPPTTTMSIMNVVNDKIDGDDDDDEEMPEIDLGDSEDDGDDGEKSEDDAAAIPENPTTDLSDATLLAPAVDVVADVSMTAENGLSEWAPTQPVEP